MERYLLQQPRKLENLAIQKLGDYIALQAEKSVSPITEIRQGDATKAEALLSRQIEIIRARLDCNVPKMLHDKLFHETIRALTGYRKKLYVRDRDNIQTNEAFGRMVETLFTKYLKVISLEYSSSMFLASLCSKSYMLTGLVQLHFFRLNMKESEIIQLLTELHSLKNLSLCSCSFVCTDNVLKCLVENCKFIEELNLSNGDVHDSSMNILSQLCHLRSIELSGTSVTQKGIETLLLSCKNIEHIIDTRLTSRALEHIASLKENDEKRFKLKSFDNDVDTILTQKQLQLIVQICPLIENITFDKYPPDGGCTGFYYRPLTHYTDNFKPLNDLQDLRQLTLKHYSFYKDKIKDVLEVRGHNLVDLVLEVFEMDLNALKCLIQTCPNLQNLSLELLFHDEEQNAFVTDLFYSNQRETAHFKKLKSLVLNMDPMQEVFLIFLLSSCPNVESLFTGYSVSLTDDIMFKVLDKNPFASLKQMTMLKSQLSMLFVDRIVQNCVNLPVLLMYEY